MQEVLVENGIALDADQLCLSSSVVLPMSLLVEAAVAALFFLASAVTLSILNVLISYLVEKITLV